MALPRSVSLLLVLLPSLTGAGDVEGVCLAYYYLIVGALGVSVVSSVIAFLVTYFCMKSHKGKKNRKEKEEGNDDEVSIQYASLQNLKEAQATKLEENAMQQKTCYASVADMRKEVQDMDNEDENVINHPESA